MRSALFIILRFGLRGSGWLKSNRLRHFVIGKAFGAELLNCSFTDTCSGLADNAQILMDPVITEQVRDTIILVPMGSRTIKGYDHAVKVFAVPRGDMSPAISVFHPASDRLTQ